MAGISPKERKGPQVLLDLLDRVGYNGHGITYRRDEMAKRSGTDNGSRKDDGSKPSHIKVWFDPDEAKLVRMVAAMNGLSPGEWAKQLLLQEVQRVLSEDMPKLLKQKPTEKK